MMHFAKLAARYMDYAEIIELHHDQKADAPIRDGFKYCQSDDCFRGKPFRRQLTMVRIFPAAVKR